MGLMVSKLKTFKALQRPTLAYQCSKWLLILTVPAAAALAAHQSQVMPEATAMSKGVPKKIIKTRQLMH